MLSLSIRHLQYNNSVCFIILFIQTLTEGFDQAFSTTRLITEQVALSLAFVPRAH